MDQSDAKLKVADLKSYCAAHGLPITGRKQELVDRVVQHRKGSSTKVADQPVTPAPTKEMEKHVEHETHPDTVKEPEPPKATSSKTRKSNPWIAYAKQYALDKGIQYSLAIVDQGCKDAYHASKTASA